MSLETGTVCMKITGREAGKLCAIVKKIDKSFVMVSGPRLVTGVKRRRCNIEHLEPVGIFIDIKDDASDEEVIEAYKKSGVVTKFSLKLPSAGDMKSEKKVSEEKSVEKKEEKVKKEAKEKPKKEEKKTKEKK